MAARTNRSTPIRKAVVLPMIETPDQITALFVIKVASIALYPFLEYYLGKTKKVKANSVLELVLHVGLSILKTLSKKTKETKCPRGDNSK
jgi:hypothetical protein